VNKSEPPDWAWKIANDSVDFRGEHLEGESLSGLDLHQRDFRRAVLRKTKFVDCDLTGANFGEADLSDANFRGAKCVDVDFSNANLSRANFYRANLQGAAFVRSNLFFTNFRESRLGQTVFANLDMETCVGLDSTTHDGPSSIGIECLYRSGGNLPVSFLKGVGLTQILLDYLPSLIEAGSPIQFHSCFISYSHTDEAFARKLWNGLRNERITVWYAPEEMKGGKKLFEQIDRAIQMHDKLLIVLSKESMSSNWVQTEIRRARKQERFSHWKSPRTQPRCRANSADFIRDVTHCALNTPSERLRIEVLTLLSGVSWPTASVILHFFHRDRYPILDFRALWSLHCEVPKQYDFRFWQEFTEFCRGLAEQTGASMRTLDRALWQYSKEKQT
jgi:hypothetical protein